MKIDKLTLKNFKFFYGEKTLDFEGKNVLLYGENGSGKSSIYWALYTLLNNAKSNDAKIKRYFTYDDEKRLLNRYMPDDATGEVSIKLDNGQNYIISADPAQININKPNDTTIKESNIASDFISYKLLSKLYDFKHGDSIDLFELFEADIFDYMPYSTTQTYAEAWRHLRREENNPPRKNSWQYRQFTGRVERFNNVFKDFINSIKEAINELLSKYFNVHYEVIINYRDLRYDDTSRLRIFRKLISPKILITIKLTADGLSGQNSKVSQPHTFLNEAKLTAIALSIRLSVLRTRVTGEDILKILVLDDLLISLDMSNRDMVVNMLLEDEYLRDYQIIMLTHDRAFYEMSKQIFNYKSRGNWKYFEMYVDRDENMEFPYIKEYDETYNQLTIAKEHFANKDYPACANYLRKEVEKQFDDFLKLDNLDAKINLAKLKENVCFIKEISKELKKLLRVLEQFENCEKMPVEIQPQKCKVFSEQVISSIESITDYIEDKFYFEEFEDVKLILKSILHPQSHNDATKPLYKKELEDAIKLMEEFSRIIEN